MTKQSMPHWLAKRAALTPDRIALMSETEQWTFAELDVRAQALARRFASKGICTDSYVALLFQNGLHVAETIHALTYLGAVMMPLNIRLSAREILWQIEDAGACLLVYDEANARTAAEIMDEAPEMEIASITEIKVCEQRPTDLHNTIDLDDLHTMIYTSGTTGYPKGVMLSYGNHWWSAVGSALNLGLYENDRWLCCVPLFHVSGLSILMRSVIYGMTAVIHENFDADAANRAIIEQGITMMSVVSTMLSQMVENLGDQRYPDTFRCMLLGGGPAPKVLLERCAGHGIPVFQSYGLTETASQIVTLAPEYSLEKLGSAGKPLFPASLRIEAEGRPVENGVTGEITLAGPNVTMGYLGREEETAETMRRGWFHTGDLGYLDEDGFLYVLDRRKDLIISGGENVYPAEIEAILLAHSNVLDAGVTGVAHDRWGEVPVAFVKVEEPLAEESLRHYCREQLAHYKVPASFYSVEKLPRNASGKLLRQKLLDLIP